jgi:ABC-2 type transport system permease protein
VTSLQATGLVAGRELKEAFRRKTLWIVFAILFVGSSAAMILPEALDHGTTRYDVSVVSASGGATASSKSFQSALHSAEGALDAKVRFSSVGTAVAARKLVNDDKADVAVVPGKQPTVIVRKGKNDTLVAFVRQALDTAALQTNLADAGLTASAINNAMRVPPARVQEVAVDDSDRGAAAAALSLVLYLVLLMLMIQAANGVAIEKANRISEVLLAVVRPGPLLFGKVIGVGLVGLTGLAIGALPVLIKAIAGGDLPAGLGPAIAIGAAWIILGLALYLTIAGALGALVERQEEAGSVLGPLSLLLIGTYILAQSTADSTLGVVLAIFPLTSPIVMPTRIALGDASGMEIAASLIVLIITLVIAVRLGAAIFRRGIVHTGRRMRLGEALRSP